MPLIRTLMRQESRRTGRMSMTDLLSWDGWKGGRCNAEIGRGGVDDVPRPG